MGMGITEKIIADHANLKEVHSGDLVVVKLDGVLSNDTSCPLAVQEFEHANIAKVFDKEKVFITLDHFTPNCDVQAANQCKKCRIFAQNQNIKHFYDVGNVGIEHAFLPEQGIVVPGQIIIGADSHTCTYGALGTVCTGVGSTDVAAAMALGETWFKVPSAMKFNYEGKLNKYVAGKDLILYTIGKIGVSGARYKTMEFTGSVIENLSPDSRFSMCNMAIEAGAKNGIMEVSKIMREYVESRKQLYGTPKYYQSDKDAEYESVLEIDVAKIRPQVAKPSLPGNAVDVDECSNVFLDQVVIGSCTNGRMEDMRAAASILQGKKVHKYTRTIIIPATKEIYQQSMREGLIDIFLDAGAIVSTPTCGPCFGGHMGLLAAGEKALSTTNRNFVGRMGSPESEVYLSGPSVAASSAIAGKIVHPEEVL